MSPVTAPCARAPGVAMRAPGSQCIFIVLAISGGRGPLAARARKGQSHGTYSPVTHFHGKMALGCPNFVKF